MRPRPCTDGTIVRTGLVTVDHADIGDIIKASRSVNLIEQIVHVPDLRIDPGTGNSRLRVCQEIT